MALAPIALISTTYEQYPGYWLKFYIQGTTTPKSMATDSSGGTLLSRAEVSSGGSIDIGFIKTVGDVIFIPWVDGDYDGFLFPTAAEADANDTANAIQVADDINADPTGVVAGVIRATSDARYSAVFGSVSAMQSLTAVDGIAYVPVTGQLVQLTSYYDSVPFSFPQGGGGDYRVMTLVEYALTPDEIGSAFTIGGFAFVAQGTESGIDVQRWGARLDWDGATGTDDFTAIQAAYTFAITQKNKTLLINGIALMSQGIGIDSTVTFKGPRFGVLGGYGGFHYTGPDDLFHINTDFIIGVSIGSDFAFFNVLFDGLVLSSAGNGSDVDTGDLIKITGSRCDVKYCFLSGARRDCIFGFFAQFNVYENLGIGLRGNAGIRLQSQETPDLSSNDISINKIQFSQANSGGADLDLNCFNSKITRITHFDNIAGFLKMKGHSNDIYDNTYEYQIPGSVELVAFDPEFTGATNFSNSFHDNTFRGGNSEGNIPIAMKNDAMVFIDNNEFNIATSTTTETPAIVYSGNKNSRSRMGKNRYSNVWLVGDAVADNAQQAGVVKNFRREVTVFTGVGPFVFTDNLTVERPGTYFLNLLCNGRGSDPNFASTVMYKLDWTRNRNSDVSRIGVLTIIGAIEQAAGGPSDIITSTTFNDVTGQLSADFTQGAASSEPVEFRWSLQALVEYNHVYF